MINTDKVRLMAELNLYEKTKGHEALKLNNSVKHLHGMAGVRNIVCGIITFILLLLIFVISEYDEIMDIYSNIGPVISAAAVILCMVVFVAAYCLYAKHMILHKASKYEGNLWRYNYKKRKLRDVLFAEDVSDNKNVEVNAVK